MCIQSNVKLTFKGINKPCVISFLVPNKQSQNWSNSKSNVFFDKSVRKNAETGSVNTHTHTHKHIVVCPYPIHTLRALVYKAKVISIR